MTQTHKASSSVDTVQGQIDIHLAAIVEDDLVDIYSYIVQCTLSFHVVLCKRCSHSITPTIIFGPLFI